MRRGFTLTELMVSLSISAIVMGGVLAAYLFLGRNLERMMFFQQQQVESRRALRNFTQDLSATVQLTTATTSQIALTKTITGGTSSVTYTYTAPTGGSTADGKLDRVESGATTHLLTHLTSFTFSYFTEAGVQVTNAPQSAKSVEFNFASSLGSSANGTSAAFTSVSPRVVLRNRAALQ
ncbi:MAG TPA: prepilin-type N-terminal cleavage/methylation domain-containing protein [Opitutaceae bacterium]|nr:prepilin-type N-terminal cleavage/methylation domain-containing protein [Opitutaceae bacterium]